MLYSAHHYSMLVLYVLPVSRTSLCSMLVLQSDDYKHLQQQTNINPNTFAQRANVTCDIVCDVCQEMRDLYNPLLIP